MIIFMSIVLGFLLLADGFSRLIKEEGHLYFFSYTYATLDGGIGTGNTVLNLRERLSSTDQLQKVKEEILKTNNTFSSVIILNFNKLE